MWFERDVVIPIIMRIVLNQDATIMELLKSYKGLTIWAGLNGPDPNPPMVSQKIIQKLPDGSEGHFTRR